MPGTLRISSALVRAALVAIALAMGSTPSVAQAASAACAVELDRELKSLAGDSTNRLLGRLLVFDERRTLPGSDSILGMPATGAAVLAAASWTTANFILLGETHDNPTHHALRAALIKAWRCVDPNRRAAAVFEHIRTDQADAIAGPPADPDHAALALLDRLAWENSGWPDGSMFRPLFAATYTARLAILPGEPAQGRVRLVAREGLASLSAEEIDRLALQRPFEPLLTQALTAELKASHCAMLPDAAVPALAVSQRYRDAHYARAMVDAARSAATVFLLAGNGHVRTDRGVPWHLAAMRPDLRTVTVMVIEVQEGRNDPAAYLPRDPTGRPAANILIFTQRATRPDPCARLKALPPRP